MQIKIIWPPSMFDLKASYNYLRQLFKIHLYKEPAYKGQIRL